MKIGGIVVCRMDSRRLPGKTLRPIHGKPLLWYVLDRCRRCPAIGLGPIVATSSRRVDDPIDRFCREQEVPVYRGSGTDVAGRMLAAARHAELDAFYRLNGDSPFVEGDLLVEAKDAMLAGDWDLVTNLSPRSYPYGVAVELVRTRTFAEVYGQFRGENHEHPTQFFYQNSRRFRIYNLTREGDNLRDVRLTVDSEADFCRFRQTVGSIKKPWHQVSYLDAVGLSSKQGTPTCLPYSAFIPRASTSATT